MATHSSVLAWRIPGTGEPGGLPSMGSHRVGHDCSDLAAAAAAAKEFRKTNFFSEGLIAQSCLTLCNPMDCSLPGSPVHEDSSGKNTGQCCHSFLQGIFPTQGSNPGLLHRRWIVYPLSHQGSPSGRLYAELKKK